MQNRILGKDLEVSAAEEEIKLSLSRDLSRILRLLDIYFTV